MQYYAKTYTGSLTPGEFLTKEQEEKFGADKLADLVKRGALAIVDNEDDTPEAPATSEKPDAPEDADEEADTEDEGDADAEPEAEEDGIEPDEGDDELPELDAAEVIDEEEKPAEKPASKGRGRKSK